MRFILTATCAVTLSMFAMNVAISASTTVDLPKSHTNKTNEALAMLELNR